MSELSVETLMRAIGALTLECEALLRRIEQVSPEVDAEESLSERVMDIEQSLGELRGVYEAQRGNAKVYPPFDELVALRRSSGHT
jgi:hypothetical protein